MHCPYCQTTIKKSADSIYCTDCGTPHHQECWDENGGCTTYGCVKNPQLQKAEPIDVGNETPANLQKILDKSTPEAVKPVSHEIHNDFETEFKRRYEEKSKFNKRRKFIFYGSLSLLVLIAVFALFVTYQKIDSYFGSDEYRIKMFVSEWETAWESMDIFKYKALLDKDYLYYDKDNRAVTPDERIKRIAYTFENYKFIKIHVSNIKITIDTAGKQYANVLFDQSYVSDKKEESGKKTLRLYRGDETIWKWKIYREYFE